MKIVRKAVALLGEVVQFVFVLWAVFVMLIGIPVVLVYLMRTAGGLLSRF